MGRLLHFDCFSGASGNMVLGCLLDLGVPQGEIEAAIRCLPLGPWQLATEEVRRGALRARWCDVVVGPPPTSPGRAARPGDVHPHDHGHHHAAGERKAAPPHDHGHGHEHGGHPHRRYAEIRAMIEGAPLPAAVKERSLRAFRILAEAEGAVHGMDIEEVAFHEVGAVDSIVDIVGACAGLVLAGAERVTCSPLPLGSGAVESRHGRIPLPAPATVEILKGFPIAPTDLPFELTTPTGAALMVAWAERFGPAPSMVLEKVAYGAGNDRPTPLPNVLRLLSGTADGAADTVLVLETNVDNVSAECAAFVLEQVMDSGALDAYATPITMKKSRLAQKLTVLCRASDQMALEAIVFRNLPTLGIRSFAVSRHVLERRHTELATPWGAIRVKEALRDGEVIHAWPEYDDLRAAAEEHGVGIARLRDEIMARYRAKS